MGRHPALFVHMLACTLLAVFAEPVLHYTRAAADQLHDPTSYVETVMSTGAKPRP